ncbi:hypothetical protein [Aureimonas pseudogalii]|uniref:Uncharacterized protein n=1 Tax=Aureimonas pseudogalii TaxID=1744844 RepID=A0A7W6EBJ0_9HYPH|nr:hypothetical protein [Aureimonas pseudogalii]MBB3996207.1 hypothetical protein [Aureimonas pseudogalii]
MTTQTDPELYALVQDLVAAGLLKHGSNEHRVAAHVARSGLASLTGDERRMFEQSVLPILAKPMREQLAVASIVRRGGYVPRKIDF